MIDKEKDLAYLKFNLHEMKTHFNEKEDEVHSLKTINDELQNEMKFVKKLNLELKEEFENEINVRRDNDKLMETKISSFEREVMETKNILIDTNKETLSLKSQLENFNIDATEKFILCRKDIETVKTDISKTSNSSIIEDMGKLKDSVTNKQTEIRSIRSHLDESLNKKTDEMTKLTSHVENIENVVTILIRMDVLKSNGLCKITNFILILVNLNSAQYFIHMSVDIVLNCLWNGLERRREI